MINYLHSYVNDRPDRLEHLRNSGDRHYRGLLGTESVWPFAKESDGRDGLWYWDDGEAIDAIKNGGFGPDVVFGWGTTGGRIADALKSYGLSASVFIRGSSHGAGRISGRPQNSVNGIVQCRSCLTSAQ